MTFSLKCYFLSLSVLLYSLLDLSVPSQTQQASCLEMLVGLWVSPSPVVSLEAFRLWDQVKLLVSLSPAASLEAFHLWEQ